MVRILQKVLGRSVDISLAAAIARFVLEAFLWSMEVFLQADEISIDGVKCKTGIPPWRSNTITPMLQVQYSWQTLVPATARYDDILPKK